MVASPTCRVSCFNGAALFQSGEHAQLREVLGFEGDRFNGAALFQSGEHPPPDPPRPGACPVLQWGRSFSERRTGGGIPQLTSFPESFNGAALFQSGERHHQPHRGGDRRASMGPLFFRAENARSESPRQRIAACFNGAALFQSGEHHRSRGRRFWGRCFNGAALFQSGELVKAIVRIIAVWHASMGPLFFRAENVPRRSCVA